MKEYDIYLVNISLTYFLPIFEQISQKCFSEVLNRFNET